MPAHPVGRSGRVPLGGPGSLTPARDRPSLASMRVTKYTHACVRIDEPCGLLTPWFGLYCM